MAHYMLNMPVTVGGVKAQTCVEFMYDFDINNQLSVEVDKILYKNRDIYMLVSQHEIQKVTKKIKDSVWDWYDGATE